MRLCASLVLLLPLTFATENDTSQQEIERTFFLSHIFNKYGTRGILTFEGLEHLLASLGLGQISFEKNHEVSLHRTADGDFEEVHHSLHLHEHNHNRVARRAPPVEEERCLRPEELLLLYGLNPDHQLRLSPSAFLNICPAIVYQLDRKVCVEPVEVESAQPVQPNRLHAWLYGLTSVLIMSLCGLLGFLLVPFMDKPSFQKLLSLLAALAVGTLSGDALLHLIPHALKPGESEESNVLRISCTFLTLMAFFVLETFIRARPRSEVEGSEEDAHSEPLSKHGHSHDDKRSVVVMVVAGDGLHNLTDGLAIGAAFSQDPVTGLATSVAVLAHELPHELGDFAVLLKGGMSIRRAVCYNLGSSVLSLFGVVIGLWVGDHEGAALWIYSITAGSFLYIALSTLVPELHKYQKSVGHSISQMLGFFLGGAIMFVIAMYEHDLHTLLKTN